MDMAFGAVAGHLMEIDFQEPVNRWSACDPEALYSKPIVKSVPSNKQGLERMLKQEARRAQRLILWLDCDREGENIAFEVLDVCLKSNPRLEVFRAQFSTLLPRDLAWGHL